MRELIFWIYTSSLSTNRWSRHPSYAGFFYWALGTQLVLQNPLSFIVHSIVLWKFFYYRSRCTSFLFFHDLMISIIAAEERALVKFFGQDYVEYRRRVGTKIPFIP